MAKVHVHTQGCSLNVSDSEAMSGLLLKAGHEVVATEEEADLLIINSCTVKSSPEQRVFYKIREHEKPLIIAGCVPQADPDNEHFANVSVVGPKALSMIVEAVNKTLMGEKVTFLDPVDKGRNAFPLIQLKQHIGIVPINAGCLSNCSYCKTKHARGQLESYDEAAILAQCRDLVNNGAKELWLTSQDTATYGLDKGTDIVSLLEKILAKPGDFRVRLGMANPQYILPRLDRLIKVLQHEKMFRFLHIPVQAGSNKVLRDMRRGYTVEQFKEVVTRVLAKIPDITIATDIIVGFPTETLEDFEQTVALIEELRIPVVNISKFYPRPDTKAATLPLLPTDKVKERSTRLKYVCQDIAKQRNEVFINKTFSVIIDEVGKHTTLVARTDNYIPVILSEGNIGERKEVAIKSAGIFDLRT